MYKCHIALILLLNEIYVHLSVQYHDMHPRFFIYYYLGSHGYEPYASLQLLCLFVHLSVLTA